MKTIKEILINALVETATTVTSAIKESAETYSTAKAKEEANELLSYSEWMMLNKGPKVPTKFEGKENGYVFEKKHEYNTEGSDDIEKELIEYKLLPEIIIAVRNSIGELNFCSPTGDLIKFSKRKLSKYYNVNSYSHGHIKAIILSKNYETYVSMIEREKEENNK